MKFTFRSNEVLPSSPRWPHQSADYLSNSALTRVSPLFAKELLAHPDISHEDTLRLQLSGALDALSDLAPWQDQDDVREFAVTTAHKLIMEILPPDPTIVTEHQQLRSPSLSEVHLLAQAADGTGDRITFEALGYILRTEPPALSEELVEAYGRAMAAGTPITEELQAIMRGLDAKDDRERIKAANAEAAAAHAELDTAAMQAVNDA